MSWNAYTYSILADQRMNQYLREAEGDRLAGEALATRRSTPRRSVNPWARLLQRLGAGAQLGMVSPARPWRPGTHDGGALPQACRGTCCGD
jgi:hypothetical protein